MGRDKTDVQQVLDDYEKSKTGRTRFAPKEPGEYIVRILPAIGGGLYFARFGLHYDCNLISSRFSGPKRSVVCPALTLEQECPICELSDRLYYEANMKKDEPLQSVAGGFRAARRVVMNLYDCDKVSKGVLTWETNQDGHEMVQALFRQRGKLVDITDEETGSDVALIFAKKNKWTVPKRAELCEEGPIELRGWAEKRHDLQKYVNSRAVPIGEIQDAIDHDFDLGRFLSDTKDEFRGRRGRRGDDGAEGARRRRFEDADDAGEERRGRGGEDEREPGRRAARQENDDPDDRGGRSSRGRRDAEPDPDDERPRRGRDPHPVESEEDPPAEAVDDVDDADPEVDPEELAAAGRAAPAASPTDVLRKQRERAAPAAEEKPRPRTSRRR